MLSLATIRSGLPHSRIVGNKVVAPGPEAADRKGWRRRKRTLTVYVNKNGDIGVNCWAGQDPAETKAWVRKQCRLPDWQPQKRHSSMRARFWERNQFLGESLRIARSRGRKVTPEQFDRLVALDAERTARNG